jgi:magnesium transporter
MIRSLYCAQDGGLRTDLQPAGLSSALQDSGGLLWVDLVGEPPEACRPILRETFGFHPLAVDDALEEAHVPKVDDWGQYVYLVLHAVAFDPQGDEPLNTLELDVFLGKNYLVTYQSRPIAAAERVWAACQRDARHLQRGIVRLLYELADELVADYMPTVEAMDEVNPVPPSWNASSP